MNNNVIDISKDPPKLNVIGIQDPGSLKLKSPKSVSFGGSPSPRKSVNFGPGIEMLMNPKKQPTSPMKSDINLSDLEALNKKLDVQVSGMSRKEANKKIFSDPTLGGLSKTPALKLNISELPSGKKLPPKPVSSSQHTAKLGGQTQDPKKDATWDGYKKFNNIPVDPTAPIPNKIPLSAEETVQKKINLIRKLNHLEKKGIKLTKKYTMEDPLAAISGEYEMLKKEKEKSNSVKFQGKMLMAFVSALEFLNGRFDPFELKLDGWAEAVNENIEDYDEVFGELHEKYGEKAKMAPELKLIFMLGGSAAMLHMTNTMFKSAMPGMDDIMRQNPELMSQFTQAAANTMSQENPGFGGFMNNMMNSRPDAPPGSPAGPPEEYRQNPPQLSKKDRTPHPDLMTRGQANFNDAVNMQNMQDPFKSDRERKRRKRPEMKGPSNLDEILSGLKTKRINLKDKGENKSVASVEEIKELNTAAQPKRRRAGRPSSKSSRGSGITMSLNGLI